MSTMTLEDSIELLEINNLENLTEKDLKMLGQRAKRRWHPDKITHTNPPKEKIKRYEANFKRIPNAIEILTAYLNGEIKVGEKYNGESKNTNYEEPIDILKRNAPEMQDTLNSLWQKIKEEFYKGVKEKTQVSDGVSVKEALKNDRKDQVFVSAVIGSLGGILAIMTFGLVVALPVGLFSENINISNEIIQGVENLSNITLITIFLLLNISCGIISLPLARVWLPNILYNPVVFFVDYGIEFYNGFYTWCSKPNITFLNFILNVFMIPVLIAKTISIIIINPLYWIFGYVFKNFTIGRTSIVTTFYAGYAEWYIDELMNKKINTMTDEELFDLGQIYNDLSSIV